MRKRILCLLTVLLLCLSGFLCSHATAPLLVDNSNLLTAAQEANLLSRLEQLRQTWQMDVVIVTVESLDGKTARDYADDFYDNNGYAADGVLLLVSMSEREWHISTSGAGITAINDAGIDYLEDRFLSDLSSGNYSRAFSAFADGCDKLIAQASTGDTYREPPVHVSPIYVLFCLIAGVVVAFIVTGSMKRQLKTVVRQTSANSYMAPGSLRLTQHRDIFLYRNVTRVARPKDTDSGAHGGSSIHTSSSGSSHGGRGGKF